MNGVDPKNTGHKGSGQHQFDMQKWPSEMSWLVYSSEQGTFLAQAALVAERERAEAKGAGEEGRVGAEQLLWQVERLQRQLDEARDEREGLLRDINFLKDASEKAKERGTSRPPDTRSACTAGQYDVFESIPSIMVPPGCDACGMWGCLTGGASSSENALSLQQG